MNLKMAIMFCFVLKEHSLLERVYKSHQREDTDENTEGGISFRFCFYILRFTVLLSEEN